MTRTKGRKAGRFSSQRAGQAQVCSRRMDLYGSVLSSLCEEAFCLPVVVDVLARVVMKGGAASDMFGNMQSPVIHTEEQS